MNGSEEQETGLLSLQTRQGGPAWNMVICVGTLGTALLHCNHEWARMATLA